MKADRRVTLDHGSVSGLPSLRLANGLIAVTVLPSAGGKILSIVDFRTGRDWLWKNPHLPLRPARYGASYVAEMDSGGWDEVLPSVLPCVSEGIDIPDHGDLVGLEWAVEETCVTPEGDGRVTMAARGRSAPWLLRRRLTMPAAEARIELDYELHGARGKAVPFLWCAHPLIAVEPGMGIELPAGTDVVVVGAEGSAPVEKGDRFAWPGDAWSAAAIAEPASRFAVKMFAGPLAEGSAAVRAPDGSAFALRFDARFAPFVGLWMNWGAWSGCGSPPYFNLGLEPSTAPCDGLDVALSRGQALHLRPGEILRWNVEVAVAAGVAGKGV